MERNNRSALEDTIEMIRSLPPGRLSKHLDALLHQTMTYEKKLVRLAREIYQFSENPQELERLLTELSDAGELYCLQRRSMIDAMCKTTSIHNGYASPVLPQRADISQDVSVSYDAASNTLRLTMPGLLPLKGKWSSYLPDKIRCALERFDREYRLQTGKKLKISPAFVLFIHHYGTEDREKGFYRDYDNQEYSSVLNALHSTGIFNDSAATHINMQMAVAGSNSFTEVAITDISRMMDLLEKRDLSLYGVQQ